MKQSRNRADSNNIKNALAALWTAASRANGKNTTTNFLRSVLTETEQIQIGRRLLIAQHLLSGHSWSHIRADLKVSPNTIDLVQSWLKQQVPEYEAATQARIKRTKQDRKPHHRTAGQNPTSWASLRHRYPGHFLLFNLIADDHD